MLKICKITDTIFFFFSGPYDFASKLIARFVQHLKKKGYSASIISDLVFDQKSSSIQAKPAKEAKKREQTQRIDRFEKRRVKGIVRQGFSRHVWSRGTFEHALAKRHSLLLTPCMQRTS